MARYSYGSSGDGVKELQELLNATGKYTLDIDGIYGNQTQQAVRDYQSNNNLTVDGVAGDQTLGHLRGNSSSTETDQEAPVVQPYQPTYTESQTVKDAQTQLDTHTAQQPGAYQSGYSEKLNALYDKIMNREPHQYDMNADVVYQQLKDRYIQQGLMASQDTMGQAAALTGGYGNTYAQAVGQQAYQQYLQGLNDKIPELAQMDLNRYQMEGDRLADQYAMMMQQENQDYARYQDAQNAWLSERDYLAGRYDAERGYDYGKWQDQQSVGLQQQNTKYDRLVNLITSTGYSPTAQELADAGMSASEAAAYGKYYTEQNTPRYSGNGYYYRQEGNDQDETVPTENGGVDPIFEYNDIADQAHRYGSMNSAEAFMYLKDIEKEEGAEAARKEFDIMEGHLAKDVADAVRHRMGYTN